MSISDKYPLPREPLAYEGSKPKPGIGKKFLARIRAAIGTGPVVSAADAIGPERRADTAAWIRRKPVAAIKHGLRKAIATLAACVNVVRPGPWRMNKRTVFHAMSMAAMLCVGIFMGRLGQAVREPAALDRKSADDVLHLAHMQMGIEHACFQARRELLERDLSRPNLEKMTESAIEDQLFANISDVCADSAEMFLRDDYWSELHTVYRSTARWMVGDVELRRFVDVQGRPFAEPVVPNRFRVFAPEDDWHALVLAYHLQRVELGLPRMAEASRDELVGFLRRWLELRLIWFSDRTIFAPGGGYGEPTDLELEEVMDFELWRAAVKRAFEAEGISPFDCRVRGTIRDFLSGKNN